MGVRLRVHSPTARAARWRFLLGYTYDLELLANRLPEGWRLAERPSTISALSDWAVDPRNPGNLREAAEEDAEAAIKQTREVLQTTLEDLKSRGYAPEEEE